MNSSIAQIDYLTYQKFIPQGCKDLRMTTLEFEESNKL